MSNSTRAIVIMFLGIAVRMSANELAWPRYVSYSGPRESTKWAIREAALNDVGMGLFYLGGLLYAVSHLIKQKGAMTGEDGGKTPAQGG